MTKLAIVATMKVKPGTRAEVLAALVAHRERCLRDEPGTLQFEVLVPTELDDTIMIYEVYADAGAFKVHWDGASMKQARIELGERMLSMTGVRCSDAAE